MASMIRPLDVFEAPILSGVPAFTVKYSGHIPEDVLRAAFRELCDCHPILKAAVEIDNSKYQFSINTDHYPQVLSFREDDDEGFRAALGMWQNEDAVAQLLVQMGDTGGAVTLRATHAIADGAAIFAILDHYFRLCSCFAGHDTEEINRTRGRIPQPPSAMFDERWFGRVVSDSNFDYEVDPMKLKEFNPQASGVPTVHRTLKLDAKVTARLIGVAKRRNITPNSLLSGVIASTELVEASRSESEFVEIVSAVNLRNRVHPPVRSTETTNFIGTHSIYLDKSINRDPFFIGATLRSDLSRAISDQRIELWPPQGTWPPAERPSQKGVQIRMSNAGLAPKFVSPPNVSIDDLEARTGDLGSSAISALYGVITYADKLTIYARYPVAQRREDQADVVIDRILQTIYAACT
ncbi:phthiocerol/phthiodiolone dimycocerosyl transferase family protein [Haloechinothrix salitolerans]|uniref:Phthiocerol/phthiodiolone dimycocerosyl transferase n=1 Tax=Haloechinothrix salitolerans TaxID=926830 RepID=A0ABW2BY69_9PSEU